MKQQFVLIIETGSGINPNLLEDDIYKQLAQYGYYKHTVKLDEYSGKELAVVCEHGRTSDTCPDCK